MKLPEKEFYSLSEVAQEWGCTEKDILQFAEFRKIEISLSIFDEFKAHPISPFGKDPSILTVKGYYPLDATEIKDIIHSNVYPRFEVLKIRSNKISTHKNALTNEYSISDKVQKEMSRWMHCHFVPLYKPLMKFVDDLYLHSEDKFKFENLSKKYLVNNNTEPNQKSITSLKKIIIGMAIGGYGYNPQEKRSEIPRQIVEDIERSGLSIDVDTVRKWLRESAEILPRNNGT